MTELQRTIEEATGALRAVAGDWLEGLATYVLVDSLDHRLVRDACAWTSPVLDFTMQSVLESHGLWEGPGFACVLSARQVGALSGDRLRRFVVGASIHELSHWLSFAEHSKAKRSTGPWSGHDVPFMRAAIYCTWRARDRHDPSLTTEDVAIAGFDYRLSNPGRYEQALSPHYGLAHQLPLRELMQLAPPTRFVELFNADASEYWRRQR